MEATIAQPTLTDYEIERGKPMPSFNHTVDEELVFHNDVLTDPTNGISIDLKKVFR